MTAVFLSAGPLLAKILWRFVGQTESVRPWEKAPVDWVGGRREFRFEHATQEPLAQKNRKTGLVLYLFAATLFFGSLVYGYLVRQSSSNLEAVVLPGTLLLTSGALLASCVVVWRTVRAARHGLVEPTRLGLTWGFALSIAFLVGQIFTWQQLAEEAQWAARTPAHSHFVLLMAVHALHLLAGLWVWGQATIEVWLRLKVEQPADRLFLCGIYWVYLLVVWFGLIAVLFTG